MVEKVKADAMVMVPCVAVGLWRSMISPALMRCMSASAGFCALDVLDGEVHVGDGKCPVHEPAVQRCGLVQNGFERLVVSFDDELLVAKELAPLVHEMHDSEALALRGGVVALRGVE